MPHHNIPIVLTIAGSDSSGGAGIQADIKSISATGSYACSVITAITAQNTRGVYDILPIPLATIGAQLDAVFSDLNIMAVKIGMLADSDIIQLIAKKLAKYQPKYIVLDPVMVATSGDRLLKNSAIDTLKTQLIPFADVVTPNIPEACILSQLDITSALINPDLIFDALKPYQCKAILLKGGHEINSIHSNDTLITASQHRTYTSQRINTTNTHGTGCSLSSAIASYLAQGQDLFQSVASAKEYVHQAISGADALAVGQGHGPIDHFYRLRKNKE
jgi:hydroxymethylpyrimidine/phosphomethylpyrimidine kinase